MDQLLTKGAGSQDGVSNNPSGKDTTVDNVNSCESARPTGNSKDYALRKLRRDRPDLHEKVLKGLISTNKAMLDAGFRKKQISVAREKSAIYQKTCERLY
jgi:hypothetical protein